MSLLFETIKLDNGIVHGLEYHQQRVQRAFEDLFPGSEPLCLGDFISGISLPGSGLFRLRVSYDASGASCSVFPYVRRKISRLVLVAADDLSYEHKYEDRSRLVAYASGLAPDEEALFTVRGYVTDTTFSNIVFFDGKDYFTPSTYLLKGTMRQRFIDSGKVRELAVRADLIKEFQSAHLINAMNDVGDIQFQTSEFV